jgi:cyanophycinase
VTVFLVGGGPDTVASRGLLDPFVIELTRRATALGRVPRLAVALVDYEGSAARFLPEYVDALGEDVFEVVPVLLCRGGTVDARAFDGVDGIVVGGGPTPVYLAGLLSARERIQEAVTGGVPYLGFSAGAMIAASAALVGGHRRDGKEVCPEEWSEGLGPVTVREGLGLVGFTVDVHTAQAGTLSRTVAVVEVGEATTALGIDEDTCVTVSGREPWEAEDLVVSGSGSAWLVRATDVPGSVVVRRARGRAPAAGRPQSSRGR